MADFISAVANHDGVDAAAHVIQVALTPVFLLSGIGTLLNMFNMRQNRISDHAAHINDMLAGDLDPPGLGRLVRQLGRLHRRRLAMDAAILFGAVGGATTCAAALVLFLGGVRDLQILEWLTGLFGGALACTVVGLLCFVIDCVLAWHGIRMDGPMPHLKN